jgi:DNA-binding NarL/FixJ family response regulator
MISLALCDDHVMLRTAVGELLSRDGQVRVALSVADATALLDGLAADPTIGLVLLDLRLGAGGLREGLGLIRLLRQRRPELPVIALSMQDDPETVRRAFEAGARGFVGKSSPLEVLRTAVAHVLAGGRFVAPDLVTALTVAHQCGGGSLAGLRLSELESRVLSLLCDGHRGADIARSLGVSERTVTAHRSRIMQKLQVDTQADLLSLCEEWRGVPGAD